MFVGLWLHQKSLYIENSWFESTKKLDVNSKGVLQIEFVVQLKNTDGVSADGLPFMFILAILK